MLPIRIHLVATAFFLGAAATGNAQDSGPLLDLLVRKGIITTQEAEDVRRELGRPEVVAQIQPQPQPAPESEPFKPATTVSTKKGKFLERLTLSGRIQAQAVNLSTNIRGTDADPADTSHMFMRRVYFGAKADLVPNWSANFVYDFAGTNFDSAYVQWKHSPALSVQAGLRKVPFGLEEEFVSSGALKAIERSPATRFFVEANNGRRLGAGSYRVGLFAEGENGSISYGFSISNPERADTADDAASAGSASTNTAAYWGHVAYHGEFGDGGFRLGASLGLLPDQGGRAIGAGDDLLVGSVFADASLGRLSLLGEVLWSDNERGAASLADSNAFGWYIQPSWSFGRYEAVVRYSQVDSDGRGISLSDGVRSAPSGGTMDKLSEWFLGGSYYFNGNDTKLQLGYIFAESKDTLTGAPAKATARGLRSQVQVQF